MRWNQDKRNLNIVLVIAALFIVFEVAPKFFI